MYVNAQWSTGSLSVLSRCVKPRWNNLHHSRLRFAMRGSERWAEEDENNGESGIIAQHFVDLAVDEEKTRK